jgi:hypothetical protein
MADKKKNNCQKFDDESAGPVHYVLNVDGRVAEERKRPWYRFNRPAHARIYYRVWLWVAIS